MTQNTIPEINKSHNSKNYAILSIIFFAVAIIGLSYVKWNPYYHKAFTAAAKHSIGTSIITGKAAKAPSPSWAAALEYAKVYFKAVWKAVILGLLLGSLVQVLIPENWIKKAFGGKNIGSTAAAGAAAIPGMMCTCCAAPVAAGLRKSSASVNAALSFFIASPVLNPATIIFMGFVLSWKFALFRVVAGLLMVIGISTIAGKLVKEDEIINELMSEEVKEKENILIRWAKALWQLIVDTIPAYLLVVFLLGALRAWLFPAVGTAWGNGIAAIILLSVTGTLFVIPTAAEIPVVQTLMAFGLGVGPAAALLMTLPAVSLPSLLIVKRAFPTRVLVFIAASVALVGILSGILGMLVL